MPQLEAEPHTFDVAVDHLTVRVSGEMVDHTRSRDLPLILVKLADPHSGFLLRTNTDDPNRNVEFLDTPVFAPDRKTALHLGNDRDIVSVESQIGVVLLDASG